MMTPKELRIQPEIKSLADYLGQRAASERRQKLIQEAVRDICDAGDPDVVLSRLFRAWTDLAGDDIDICFYASQSSGLCKRILLNGRRQLSLPLFVSPPDGHIGKVVYGITTEIYAPNLPENDDHGFHDESQDHSARTTYTLAMSWYEDGRRAAIQAVSTKIDAFVEADRKAMATRAVSP
jgi:hypothetical protein